MSGPASQPADSSTLQVESQKGARSRPAIHVLAMFVSGAVATGLCYVAVGNIGEFHPIPEEFLNLGATPTVEERTAASAAKLSADSGNAMVWLGVTGAILAGALALTIGWIRRAGIGTLTGTIAGVLMGGAMGYLAGYLATSYHNSLSAGQLGSTSTVEHQFMMMHGLAWGLIGLGVGLGCGLSTPAIRSGSVLTSIFVAGALGCLAGVAFPLVVGIAAPLVDSSLPIPRPGQGRWIWMGLGCLLMAVGLSRTSWRVAALQGDQ